MFRRSIKGHLAVLLLLAGVSPAWGDDPYYLRIGGFGLAMSEKPMTALPLAPDYEDFSPVGFAAWLASNGNAMYRHIRDTQWDWYWYGAQVWPLPAGSSLEVPFVWPESTLVLQLEDGTEVPVGEVVSMWHFTGPQSASSMVRLFPQERPMLFRDILVEPPRSQRMCIAYVGVRKTFDPDHVVDVVLKAGTP